MWQVLHDVGQALRHVHAMGLVHLDVKPANLLIGDEGTLSNTFLLFGRTPFDELNILRAVPTHACLREMMLLSLLSLGLPPRLPVYASDCVYGDSTYSATVVLLRERNHYSSR